MILRPAAATGLAFLALLNAKPDEALAETAPAVQTTQRGTEPREGGPVSIMLNRQSQTTEDGALAAITSPTAVGGGVSLAPVDGGFLITVPMQAASQATLRQDGREVLVSFPHPLPEFNAKALQDQMAGLLEGISVGYDTLLLRLAPGVTVSKASEQGAVRLALQPNPAAAGSEGLPAQAPTEADKEGAQRLRLLGAQLLARTGQVSEARQQFGDLILTMPENPEPMSGLAGVEQAAGRWRQALAYYERAHQLDPEDPSIADAIDAIEHEHAPRLRSDFEFRRTNAGQGSGISTAAIAGLSGQQNFGDAWHLGVSINTARVNASQVQQPSGAVESITGLRSRSELSLQHDGLDGIVVAASAYLAGTIPGVGVRGELPDDYGTTYLRADYRRPDWDFFQSIVDNGTRDRIAIGRRQLITQDLTARLDVGANRYSLQGWSNLATTITVNGELRLSNLAGVHGLSVAYVLDGEYLNKISTGINATGQLFDRIDIASREVHAGVFDYVGSWNPGINGRALTYELSAGYGADRYGKSGPIVAAVLTYPVGDFELGLRAGYVNNIGRTAGSTAVFAGSLTRYF
jgi:tetratricopeptide (TPR) repeat protein